MNEKVNNVVKIFDNGLPYWTNDLEFNMLFIKGSLHHCYDLFKARGYLFLNDVYKTLGFPLTRQGQIAGWIYNEEHMKDTMWTFWKAKDSTNNINITFEVLENILDVLPEE